MRLARSIMLATMVVSQAVLWAQGFDIAGREASPRHSLEGNPPDLDRQAGVIGERLHRRDSFGRLDARSAAREAMLTLRKSGDASAGSVNDLLVSQFTYSDAVNGNTVFLSWEESTNNFGGVTLSVFDVGQNMIRSQDLPGLDAPGPGQRNSFEMNGLPEGTLTFRIEETGGATMSEATHLILGAQPFADIQGFGCREGASLGAGNCQLVLTWETAEPRATAQFVTVTDGLINFNATRIGAEENVIVENWLDSLGQLIAGLPPGEYAASHFGALFDPEGVYESAMTSTACTLACAGGVCLDPLNLDLCQLVHGQGETNAVFATWDVTGDYASLNIYVDGDLVDFGVPVAGDTNGAFLPGLAPGERTIAVEGVCSGGGTTELLSATFEVLPQTPHPNPVDGDVVCQFIDDDPARCGGADTCTTATWLSGDPSVSADVFVQTADGLFFVGTLTGIGALASIFVTSTAPGDVIVLQFFTMVDGACHGSELISCVTAGNSFIRGVCNGNGVVPQISDPVFGLNWLFSPGAPTPPCIAACNANGDTNVDLSDMVYVLNFLFGGGPPPSNWDGTDPVCETAPVEECARANDGCPL